jgi:excinuclease UvrABC nuclease subunit
MVKMEQILVQNLDNQQIGKLPENCGVIAFWQGQEILYAIETVNIRFTAAKLLSLKEDDSAVGELFEQAESISIQSTSGGTDAIIRKKLLTEKHKAEHSHNVNLWKDYVYLAINPAEFPFVKISEYTEEDWFYIGPFRSRFFLTDLIELMSRLLKLPHCDVKSGPCDKYNNGRCRGWCVLIKSETGKTDEENLEQPHLQKLDALLKEAYVHADNSLMDMIIREKQKYEAGLEFSKAELLKPEIELLKRYREWLIFLYKIKNLNYVTDKVSVKNGQLVMFKADNKEHFNPYINIPYRANEVLALNKNMLDEARILYQERV